MRRSYLCCCQNRSPSTASWDTSETSPTFRIWGTRPSSIQTHDRCTASRHLRLLASGRKCRSCPCSSRTRNSSKSMRPLSPAKRCISCCSFCCDHCCGWLLFSPAPWREFVGLPMPWLLPLPCFSLAMRRWWRHYSRVRVGRRTWVHLCRVRYYFRAAVSSRTLAMLHSVCQGVPSAATFSSW